MILMETIGRRATFALNFGVYSACTVVLVLCMSRSTITKLQNFAQIYIACALSTFTNHTTCRTWIVALLFVGRAVMAGAFQTGYIYTAEVYPTTLRSTITDF